MRSFSEYGAHVQTLFLLALMVLFLLQLYLQNLHYNYKEKIRLALNCLPMIAAIVLSVILMRHRNCVECYVPISLAGVSALTLALYGYTIAAIIRQRRRHDSMLTADSVKEACDNLPFGLCFFAQNELPVLVNGQMTRITGELIGKNMQSLGELNRALERPADSVQALITDGNRIYRTADGREWFFASTEITDHTQNRYTQVTAVDRTQLNRLNAELKTRNKELKKMMNRLDRIRANIADSIRQQEILTAKMRLHNKMGGCMTAARRYYSQLVLGSPHNRISAQKAELLNSWNRTVADLLDEIGQTDDTDPLDEPVRLAKSAGMDVVIHGEMPKDPEVYYLFVTALRECITNAIHHAEASVIDVDMNHRGGVVTGVYTNNGKIPEHEIVEGGGLTSLRSRIEGAGGTLTVHSLPVFTLTVTLPENIKSEEDDDDDEGADS